MKAILREHLAWLCQSRPCLRRRVVSGCATGRRDWADCWSHRRGSGGSGALRDARLALALHRLRATRQHRTRPATCHHRR